MGSNKAKLIPQSVCRQAVILIVMLLVSGCSQDRQPSDPLPSWNDGAARTSIVEFVQAVTDESGPGFVPVPESVCESGTVSGASFTGTLSASTGSAGGVFTLGESLALTGTIPRCNFISV